MCDAFGFSCYSYVNKKKKIKKRESEKISKKKKRDFEIKIKKIKKIFQLGTLGP